MEIRDYKQSEEVLNSIMIFYKKRIIIAVVKYGSEKNLSNELGKSDCFVRKVIFRNTITGMRKLVKLINELENEINE